MNRIEAPKDGRTEQLVDTIMKTIWLKGVLKQYRDLPKQTGRERKSVNNLVARTAAGLLQNPQDISIADKTWQRHEACEIQAEKLGEPFSELVRKERLELIKNKWEYVKPEQLAGLVRICSNKDESQKSARESAEDLLKNYFKGPRSRNQRVNAYYNFVSATLDLAGEEEAFKEGMKIVLHATDILPRNPNLIEQIGLLSMPYDENEEVFQKLLIAKSVINQICFMGSQDFSKYHRENRNFMTTDEEANKEWRKRQQSAKEKIGPPAARKINDKMMNFSQTLEEPLSEERKQELMGIWPFDVAFNEKDPLNQKFQKIQLQLASLA